MRKTLLIGNGLNRTLDDKYSATNLLKELCTLEDIDIFFDEKNQLPFQLLFESIGCEYIRKGKKNDVVNDNVKKYLLELNKKDNGLIRELDGFNNKYDSIITTNYDFALEYNLFGEKSVKTEAIGRNRGYKYKDIIYHIHGDFGKSHTICLGRINYQKYLKSNTSNVKNEFYDYKNVDEIVKVLPIHLRKFFSNDIDIIGLNLDSTELIIWFVLTLRASLMCKSDYGIINSINYYNAVYPADGQSLEELNNQQNNIKRYLKKLSVNYIYDVCNVRMEKGEYYRYYYADTIRQLLK